MRLGVLLVASLFLALVAVACGEAEAPHSDATSIGELTPLASPTETPTAAEPSPTPVPTEVPNICRPNPSPVNPADPNIVVRSPEPGEVVSSPFLVTGLARVFEGQFDATIYGEIGGVIAQAPAQAELGQELSPFQVELTFAVAREQPACLWVFDRSAEDGSPVDVVQVPIALAPPPQPTPSVTSTPAPTSTPSR